MPFTLLVVDDAPAVRTMLRDYLEAQGYIVVTATNGLEALEVARKQSVDLVLLDVMMPGIDGFEVIREFRRERDTPIILLTARVAETDKVVGLELGADDFVTKPFSLHELTARIRAVLRRARPVTPAQDVLRFEALVLDRARHRVSIDSDPVRLTPSEFDILEALMEAPGRVLSRWQLLGVLGKADERVERTVDVHVRNLRTKIEADPAAPRYVQTVFGVGYRIGDG